MVVSNRQNDRTPDDTRGGAASTSDMQPQSSPGISGSVLCVDFDGTLTPTDSLYECLVLAIRMQPWLLLRLPFWLFKGRAYVKGRLIAIAAPKLRVDLFPRNADVVALINKAREQGAKVELVSAAHSDLLGRYGENPVFDAVFGSHDETNLKGAAKAKFLTERHPEGFAYIGDSAADLHVWRVAQERFGVSLSSRVRRRLAQHNLTIEELTPRRSRTKALLRAMRPHQWVKNLLVFVSLGLDLQNVNSGVVLRFLTTFVAFCVLTSGTYIINDLTDLASDRLHPRKRFRPLASGALPIPIGIGASVVLIGGGLLIGFAGSLHIGATLLIYLSLTFAYSFGLKRLAIIDVLTVAILFTSRIVAGAFSYDGPVSRWIIVFSLFLFASLALMKRTVETASLGASGAKEISGRGYRASDHTFLMTSGLAFGVGAVIVFSLYVSEMVNGRQQYHSPSVLWVCTGVLAYWILRMWMQTTRGEMHDDPILHAIRDRVSVVLGGIIFAVAVLAQIS
jgi:4-hydroxybenzoate polyprenyltransferase